MDGWPSYQAEETVSAKMWRSEIYNMFKEYKRFKFGWKKRR